MTGVHLDNAGNAQATENETVRTKRPNLRTTDTLAAGVPKQIYQDRPNKPIACPWQSYGGAGSLPKCIPAQEHHVRPCRWLGNLPHTYTHSLSSNSHTRTQGSCTWSRCITSIPTRIYLLTRYTARWCPAAHVPVSMHAHIHTWMLPKVHTCTNPTFAGTGHHCTGKLRGATARTSCIPLARPVTLANVPAQVSTGSACQHSCFGSESLRPDWLTRRTKCESATNQNLPLPHRNQSPQPIASPQPIHTSHCLTATNQQIPLPHRNQSTHPIASPQPINKSHCLTGTNPHIPLPYRNQSERA